MIIVLLFFVSSCADANPGKLCLIDEMTDSQTHLFGLLNFIPKDHYVLMGQRYLIDLVNATLPSLLKDENLRTNEIDVRYC